MDWDDAYSNAAYIPNAESFVEKWARDAAAFRGLSRHDLDIPYGARTREKYDLFFPDGDAKGLFVFVHGGYWLEFDKSSWSHLAGAATEHGWTAMLPSYDLCPDVSISEITRQIGSAITHAARREPGPIVIAGHSAGAHLAARMMCANGPLAPDIAQRIQCALGISGLYDLRPLQKTGMNEQLNISDVEAISESPILLKPRLGAKIVAWVGADERPEFIRQSKEFTAVWNEKGASVNYVEAPGQHHFDVIDGLADPHSDMIARALMG
jgi:acetyl esterase/lipase